MASCSRSASSACRCISDRKLPASPSALVSGLLSLIFPSLKAFGEWCASWQEQIAAESRSVLSLLSFLFRESFSQMPGTPPVFIKPLMQSHLWKGADIYGTPTVCQARCHTAPKSARLAPCCPVRLAATALHLRKAKFPSRSVAEPRVTCGLWLASLSWKWNSLFYPHTQCAWTTLQCSAPLPWESCENPSAPGSRVKSPKSVEAKADRNVTKFLKMTRNTIYSPI